MPRPSSRLHDQLNNWFLDYASYVILERAVPHIEDGLKPVQRRILHSMQEMEDGRYNKVQTIVGHTAKYHPHGDMAVKDALVNLGNKGWLIDRQGSWGNLFTGDGAAAGRYIEARLSPFAKDHVFHPAITPTKANYDGRFLEPVFLPVKVPLLLMQGAEGIAVGLSCNIVPHNFGELMDACIACIRQKKFTLLPDFPQGGLLDVSEYRKGAKGGKLRSRALIKPAGAHCLEITELPAGVTTVELKESLVQASLKGNVKIREIRDHTTSHVSIFLDLPPDEDPARCIETLFVFTKCEVSITVNAVVISNNQPAFTNVESILRHHVDRTREIIRQDLTLAVGNLAKQIRRAELERAFIIHKIYKKLEKLTSPARVLSVLRTSFRRHGISLEPGEENFLLGLPIRRIAKFSQADMEADTQKLISEQKALQKKLDNLTDTLVAHYAELKQTYAAQQPRRTKIVKFTPIQLEQLEPQYQVNIDTESGFVGTQVKGSPLETPITKTTDLLGVSALGTARINRVKDREFFGEKLVDIRPFDKSAPITYSLVYTDQETGRTYAKRFRIDRGLIRNKEYCLTQQPGDAVIHISKQEGKKSPPDLHLRLASPKRRLGVVRKVELTKIPIKGMSAQGILVGKTPVLQTDVTGSPGKTKKRA
jgi:topoisomerase-4 subunit A